MEKIPIAAMGIFSGVYIKTRLINAPKQNHQKSQNLQKARKSQLNEENIKRANDFPLYKSKNFESKIYHLDSNPETNKNSCFNCEESVHSNANSGGYYLNFLNAQVDEFVVYRQEVGYHSPYAEFIYSEPYKK